MAAIRIQLVTWNGAKYIPYLFASLRNSKFTDWELAILDNCSTDNTVALMQQELKIISAPHSLVARPHNTGFAPAHNALFREVFQSGAKYVLLLNQDMVIIPDFLERLYYFMETHDDVGACGGRLLKWNFPEPTEQIDSLGLRVFKNHRVVEHHGGEDWRSEEEDVKAIEMFGVSGALPLYRVAALKEVAFAGEVFDEDFFSYKEDVDLAWRLRILGWHAFTVLDAVAYHDRSASGPKNLSNRSAAQNRKNKSALANFYSYRNHLLMLIKNFGATEWRTTFFPTVWYELKKFGFVLLTEPFVFFRAWGQIIKLLPRMAQKRTDTFLKRRASSRELTRWFV